MHVIETNWQACTCELHFWASLYCSVASYNVCDAGSNQRLALTGEWKLESGILKRKSLKYHLESFLKLLSQHEHKAWRWALLQSYNMKLSAKPLLTVICISVRAVTHTEMSSLSTPSCLIQLLSRKQCSLTSTRLHLCKPGKSCPTCQWVSPHIRSLGTALQCSPFLQDCQLFWKDWHLVHWKNNFEEWRSALPCLWSGRLAIVCLVV